MPPVSPLLESAGATDPEAELHQLPAKGRPLLSGRTLAAGRMAAFSQYDFRSGTWHCVHHAITLALQQTTFLLEVEALQGITSFPMIMTDISLVTSHRRSCRPLALSIRAEQVIVDPETTDALGCTTIHLAQTSNC